MTPCNNRHNRELVKNRVKDTVTSLNKVTYHSGELVGHLRNHLSKSRWGQGVLFAPSCR